MSSLIEVITEDQMPQRMVGQIENLLVALSETTNLPMTYFSPEGEVRWEYNRQKKFCISNRSYYRKNSACNQALQMNMNISRSLGECYMSLCESDVVSMTYAFEYGGKQLGAFVAGPVIMGVERERVIKNFLSRVPKEYVDFAVLLSTMDNIKVYEPKEVTFLFTLFSHVFSGLDDGQREKNEEQNSVSTRIIEMKRMGKSVDYPYQAEESLQNTLRGGSIASALAHLGEYINGLMVSEAGDIPLVRLRLIIMLSGILRQQGSESYYRNLPLLDRMAKASSLQELVRESREIVQVIAQNNSDDLNTGTSELVRQAVKFIQDHYTEPMSLENIAEALHSNKSYLSTIFKKTTGKGVTEYITDLRLNKAARDLGSTGKGITDIAFSCGFETVSYFAKLFREKYGITPTRYRLERGKERT